MQSDYLRNILLLLQFDCMKTQGEIAPRFLDIDNRKTRKNQTKPKHNKQNVHIFHIDVECRQFNSLGALAYILYIFSNICRFV